MGYLNAQVGSENAGYERVRGRHSCGSNVRTENTSQKFVETFFGHLWNTVLAYRDTQINMGVTWREKIKTESTTLLSMENGKGLYKTYE